MSNHELARTRATLQELGADWALLSSPENVTYVSHYEVPIEFGPLTHLNYGPVLALFGVQEEASLLIANRYYADAARQQTTFDDVIGFGILEVFEQFDKQERRNNFVAALRQALRQVGLGNSSVKLGVEERTLPMIALQTRQSRRSFHRWSWWQQMQPWLSCPYDQNTARNRPAQKGCQGG